jgi:hypothetical protein
MWEFLDSGIAKKSGILTRAVINFSSGTDNQTCLQKSVKKQGQNSLHVPENGNYAKAIMT